MEVLNQTWSKEEDGTMTLVSEEKVQIPDIPVEPDYRTWIIKLEKRLDALERKSEGL